MSEKKTIVVLGATGIIGQHMMTDVPPTVDPIFVSRRPGPLTVAHDLGDNSCLPWLHNFLNLHKPWAVVNLAGENEVDKVEWEPAKYDFLNSSLPKILATWCGMNYSHYVHVSTQAVYSEGGQPVSWYGKQKDCADVLVRSGSGYNWTIVRPTFVLGVRPFPGVGRENPAEAILSGRQKKQVNNRWFSISFAWEVAEELWKVAQGGPQRKVIEIGSGHLSRAQVYEVLTREKPEEVAHESFPLIAPRPLNTSYVASAEEIGWIPAKMGLVRADYEEREKDSLSYRALELAAFLGKPEEETAKRLFASFQEHHANVAKDFREYCSVYGESDKAILNWYRQTEAYLWELTSYHCDRGFNYRGMCQGIAERLKTEKSVDAVMCLGDGIGDLSLSLYRHGLSPIYHDLDESRTADFARFRFWAKGVEIPCVLSPGWTPMELAPDCYDAIVSLDFLEHLPNVEEWVRWVYYSLSPGGLFCAQNAFNMGSGMEGSIPMHLTTNDHWEKDWDPLLSSIGFKAISSNWYQKP